jgi:hypothetical protein
MGKGRRRDHEQEAEQGEEAAVHDLLTTNA